MRFHSNVGNNSKVIEASLNIEISVRSARDLKYITYLEAEEKVRVRIICHMNDLSRR